MKNIYPTIFIFLLVILSWTPLKSIAQTTNADAVIEKMSLIYKEWGGMDIKFSANIRSEKNGVSESFEGTIIMKNNKFVLTTPDMIIWFDGKIQWTYIPRNKEVNINTPTDGDLSILNPMFLLQNYKKDFNVSYIGESTSANAKMANDIVLTSKKKEDIEKIEVQIEKNTSLPAKLVVTMHNDIRSTVAIKEIKESSPSDETFTFPKNAYPDAEIIDLR